VQSIGSPSPPSQTFTWYMDFGKSWGKRNHFRTVLCTVRSSQAIDLLPCLKQADDKDLEEGELSLYTYIVGAFIGARDFPAFCAVTVCNDVCHTPESLLVSSLAHLRTVTSQAIGIFAALTNFFDYPKFLQNFTHFNMFLKRWWIGAANSELLLCK